MRMEAMGEQDLCERGRDRARPSRNRRTAPTITLVALGFVGAASGGVSADTASGETIVVAASGGVSADTTSGGDAVGTASGVFVCTDPSASILWKTVTDASLEVSVDWPDGAVAATLTVTPDSGAATAVPVPEGADAVSVALALPEDEASERVVTLALAFADADGQTVDNLGQTATLGLVRGTSGRSARCVPNAASRRWGRRKEGHAVIPVPEGVESVSLDGGEAVAVEAPCWFAWNGLANGAHEVAGGDATAGFEVVPGGVTMLIR